MCLFFPFLFFNLMENQCGSWCLLLFVKNKSRPRRQWRRRNQMKSLASLLWIPQKKKQIAVGPVRDCLETKLFLHCGITAPVWGCRRAPTTSITHCECDANRGRGGESPDPDGNMRDHSRWRSRRDLPEWIATAFSSPSSVQHKKSAVHQEAVVSFTGWHKCVVTNARTKNAAFRWRCKARTSAFFFKHAGPWLRDFPLFDWSSVLSTHWLHPLFVEVLSGLWWG